MWILSPLMFEPTRDYSDTSSTSNLVTHAPVDNISLPPCTVHSGSNIIGRSRIERLAETWGSDFSTLKN